MMAMSQKKFLIIGFILDVRCAFAQILHLINKIIAFVIFEILVSISVNKYYSIPRHCTSRHSCNYSL